MRKTIIKFFINFSIFWIFIDTLPNLTFTSGLTGKLFTSIGFSLAINLIPGILGFFKFPRISIITFVSTVFGIYGYLYLINNYLNNFIQFYPTYIGNTDLLFVKIPILFNLNEISIIYLVSSVILSFCSIILIRLVK